MRVFTLPYTYHLLTCCIYFYCINLTFVIKVHSVLIKSKIEKVYRNSCNGFTYFVISHVIIITTIIINLNIKTIWSEYFLIKTKNIIIL